MAMRSFKPRGSLDRTPSADLFRHTLARIPSHFGRLMYLSSLRDPNTGAYRHYGLQAAFGRDQSAAALQTSHARSFRDWLKLELSEKHADLLAYIETLDDPKGLVVKYWLESQGYKGCVPDSAGKADRALYLDDIQRLLTAVTRSSAASSRAPAECGEGNLPNHIHLFGVDVHFRILQRRGMRM